MLQRRSTSLLRKVVEGNAMITNDRAEQDSRHVYQMPFQQLLSEKLFFKAERDLRNVYQMPFQQLLSEKLFF